MTANSAPDRYIEHWETVAVTALPTGWRNVYRLADGGVFTAPCPAILLQEHRATEAVWDVITPGGGVNIRTRVDRHTAPYQTRSVFAALDECGYLEPVTETSNYVTTVAPEEDPGGDDENRLTTTKGAA